MANAAGNIRIALISKEAKMGLVSVLFADLLKASKMTLQQDFNVGGGTLVCRQHA